jgi:SMODS-associating 2TM, beta-strand rich effector domain
VPTANWTRIVIGLAAVVAISIVWATRGTIDVTYAKALVTASGVVVLFLLAYDRWAWRWPPFRWFTRRPILHGTWKAELRTSYPARAHETIECYLAIAQTYSQICVDVLFDRSSSRSMSGDLVLEGGRWVLYYVFHTQADALHREGNPPGRGGAALVVAREPQVQLAGDYWTERDTRGTVRTLGHTAKVYTTFEAARAAAYHPV